MIACDNCIDDIAEFILEQKEQIDINEKNKNLSYFIFISLI